MELPVTSLTITDTQTTAFVALLSALATTASHDIVLDGKVDADFTLSATDVVKAVPNPFGFPVPLLRQRLRLLLVWVSLPVLP